LIEISVPAEQGDSGGPVFNQQKELVGVLFGSDEIQTTMASHCGRVIEFTKQASQNVANLPETPDSLIQIASQSRQTLFQRCAEQVGMRSDSVTEYVNVTMDPSQHVLQSSSAAASNFGGVRARRNSPVTPTRQLVTRRKIFGFLNVRYEMSPQKTSPNNSNIITSSDTTVTASQIPIPMETSDVATKSTANFANLPIPIETANDNKTPAKHPDNSKVIKSYFKPVQNSLNSSVNSKTVTNTEAFPSYSSSPTASSTIPVFSNSSPEPSPVFAFPAAPIALQATDTSNTVPASSATTLISGNNNNDTPLFNATNEKNSNPVPTPPRYTTPSAESFNTSRQNMPPVSQQTKMSGSYLSDNELAAQYALDEDEMLADEHAPKYTEEYGLSMATESFPITGSESKFDTLKIVIAILVIFFILFHTIKMMAIVEGQQK
jgi:hypothetical protein